MTLRGSEIWYLDAQLGPFPQGLVLLNLVEASDPPSAVSHGRTQAEAVVDLLSWSHAVTLPDPRVSIVLETGDDTSPRRFAQHFHGIFMPASVRRFYRAEEVALRLAALNTLLDSDRPRLQRALHLYRRSLGEQDPIDAFEDAWEGLESLNPILQRLHGLPTAVPSRRCDSCGNLMEVPVSSGVKYAVTGLLGLDDVEWNRLRALRVGIVHGIAEYTVLLGELPGATLQLTNALSAAIADCLELVQEERVPFNPSFDAFVSCEGVLVLQKPIPTAHPRTVPFLTLTVDEVSRQGDFSLPGPKQVKVRFSHKVHNLDGTLNGITHTVFVARDPGDTKASISFQSAVLERQSGGESELA